MELIMSLAWIVSLASPDYKHVKLEFIPPPGFIGGKVYPLSITEGGDICGPWGHAVGQNQFAGMLDNFHDWKFRICIHSLSIEAIRSAACCMRRLSCTKGRPITIQIAFKCASLAVE